MMLYVRKTIADVARTGAVIAVYVARQKCRRHDQAAYILEAHQKVARTITSKKDAAVRPR